MEKCLTGAQAVGNSTRPNEMMQPYAVIDSTGIERFSGSYKDCEDYAMDVETGRIPCDLVIIPIF